VILAARGFGGHLAADRGGAAGGAPETPLGDSRRSRVRHRGAEYGVAGRGVEHHVHQGRQALVASRERSAFGAGDHAVEFPQP